MRLATARTYGALVADQALAEQRLAQLYDLLYADRGDLDVYAAMVGEFGARSVVDIGWPGAPGGSVSIVALPVAVSGRF